MLKKLTNIPKNTLRPNSLSLVFITSSLFLSTYSIASSNSFRIGGGLSILNASHSGDTSSIGEGIHLESGIDFNRIFGASVNYDTVSDSYGSAKLEARTLSALADIGYMFDFGIKPYGLIGFNNYYEKVSFSGYSSSYTNNSISLGAGVRANYNLSNGGAIYTDVRYTVTPITEAGYTVDLEQFNLTIGYQFK